EFETEIDEEDIRLDYEGVDIYIDPHSSELLTNTTVDYVKTLQRQGFVFMNPNANTTCGCGSSFS
ncbi:MAG TPA: iron-sulfur cluster assembly accessory protein, partial [Flavobacteriales bacterium]|nr:iron-sulfur cluster assembly accessory protein [Flavobacteriales bacterium]